MDCLLDQLFGHRTSVTASYCPTFGRACRHHDTTLHSFWLTKQERVWETERSGTSLDMDTTEFGPSELGTRAQYVDQLQLISKNCDTSFSAGITSTKERSRTSTRREMREKSGEMTLVEPASHFIAKDLLGSAKIALRRWSTGH